MAGEIESAAIITPTYLVGHDAGGYWGRVAVTAYARLDAAQSWSAPQLSTPAAATSGTTITLDAAAAQDWTLTLGHNATLANFTNIASRVGQKGSIAAAQDATGGRTLSYGSYWYPVGGATAPAIPTGANAKFRIDYHIVSATRIDFIVQGVGV